MSDTPETDAIIGGADVWNAFEEEITALSRKLERERNEARELSRGYGRRLQSAAHDFGLHDTYEWINDHIEEHPEIFNQTKED